MAAKYEDRSVGLSTTTLCLMEGESVLIDKTIDRSMRSAELEFRAKLSEVAFARAQIGDDLR